MRSATWARILLGSNTKLFAEKVMPQLSGDVFFEWRPLWPQPMTRDSRAPLTPFRQPAMAASGLTRRVAFTIRRPAKRGPVTGRAVLVPLDPPASRG